LAPVVTPLGRAASDAKPITGGSNQKASVEGCAGQTLFDVVWRLMVRDVHSVHRPFLGDPGTPGYAVTLQFRNGSHRAISLANLGISGNGTGVELVTADGNTLDLDAGDFQKTVFRPIPQGGSYTTQFHFYFPGGTSDKSTRMPVCCATLECVSTRARRVASAQRAVAAVFACAIATSAIAALPCRHQYAPSRHGAGRHVERCVPSAESVQDGFGSVQSDRNRRRSLDAAEARPRARRAEVVRRRAT